jgi:hypothetical protein
MERRMRLLKEETSSLGRVPGHVGLALQRSLGTQAPSPPPHPRTLPSPANTHPLFPRLVPGEGRSACKSWTCVPYSAPSSPHVTCCLPRMSVREAIAMLNGA